MEQRIFGDVGKPKHSMKKVLVVLSLLITILAMVFGFLYMKDLVAQRGTRQVAAQIRVADGKTEDELFFSTMMVKKVVTPKFVITNDVKLTITGVESEDYGALTFADCTVSGIYKPRLCTASDKLEYWVTITEENDKIKK